MVRLQTRSSGLRKGTPPVVLPFDRRIRRSAPEYSSQHRKATATARRSPLTDLSGQNPDFNQTGHRWVREMSGGYRTVDEKGEHPIRTLCSRHSMPGCIGFLKG
jgi:hypothetical protein